MDITSLAIPDLKLIVPQFLHDHRGYFAETFDRETLRNHGILADFNRDNISLSKRAGTIRGLHFQSPPYALAKLVRVQQGSILDIAVDIRHGSTSFGRHVAIELNAGRGRQIYIPPGFAHGFCTLEPNTVVAYKVSGPYMPEFDTGIRWNDPVLGIEWPESACDATLSDRDARLPGLDALPPYFTYRHEYQGTEPQKS